MRTRAGLAALTLLGVAGPAAAADWYLTSESAYATNVIFVDEDSILASGAFRQARIYMVLAEADEDGASAIDVLMEFDCTEPRRRFLRLVGFNEAERRLYDSPGSRTWAPVVPGTQDKASRDFVCSGGRSLDVSASHGAAYPFAVARALLARHRAEDVRNSL
ncbi:MAG TPA: surface-adhesin E family protein [Allosphingosinicella sp.]|jgi:hypothetical protein|nr:surface-adhesin E family protein [Allosphingosinicella sp.]